MIGCFVTGTDTGIGKTVVSAGLIRGFRNLGLRAAGMKPVAVGARLTINGLRNEDAEILLDASRLELAYEWVNPFCFAQPIAPHLAAIEMGVAISSAQVITSIQRLAEVAEAIVIEGVGGWKVPLGRHLDVAGLACALDLPVILVVGLRLGCLNHAVLTTESIQNTGCQLGGWVGNTVDAGMARWYKNIETLQRILPMPCLGILPHLLDPREAERYLDMQGVSDVLSGK